MSINHFPTYLPKYILHAGQYDDKIGNFTSVHIPNSWKGKATPLQKRKKRSTHIPGP